jgi:hypothetical protein
MSDLQNQTPANTYKGLLQVGDYTNGVDSTSKYVSDGEGTSSALSLSTTKVGIGTNSPSQELEVNGDIVATTLTTSGAVTGGSVSTSGAVTAGSVSTSGAVGAGSIDVSGNVVADEYALDQTGTSSSAVAIHAPTTNELAIRTNTAERVRVDSSGNVAIGTTNASAKLHIENGDLRIEKDTKATIGFKAHTSDSVSTALALRDSNVGVDRMTIDSAGNIGINTSSPVGLLSIFKQGGLGTDIISQRWSHSETGYPNQWGLSLIQRHILGNISYTFSQDLGTYTRDVLSFADGNVLPGTDDTQDFGSSSQRWDDIYATNTTIQSSDRELKQDIEELSEAETRVAQACKGLLRKYRWKNAVAKKGDEARIHFGIIAQDLEDAFTAEGLDAGRYGMFVKNTWWTADRVIPAVEAVEAVEAVYDEEGNEVSPAVQAVEAQPEKTVTEIFENSEDAPEGATEVTQRGVRYAELLAFIIAAI